MVYEETKYIMNKNKILANKSLGQNFLIDDKIIEKIMDSAEIKKNDLIIEIGPGLGTLTKELLKKAGKVIAIEIDKRMINILADRFSIYKNLEIINEDVLKVDLDKLIKNEIKDGTIKKAKIVANLPYYITTPIIMKLLEEKINIESITVMVQKEVADRLCNTPGGKDTGAITYTVYYYSEPLKIIKVPKEAFIPIPKVDSEVIKLKIRDNPPINLINEKDFFKIIKFAFMQRRKTLVNALCNCDLFKNKDEIKQIISEIGINKNTRGEELTLEEYEKIANYISNIKK